MKRRLPPQAAIPVGRDCDCGHPLIWRNDQQWCAVYGTHPAVIHYRNRDLHELADLKRVSA